MRVFLAKMKKRGKQRKAQITIFSVVGVVLLLAVIFFIFFYGERKEISTKIPDIKDVVTKYAETCLKLIAKTALFDKIGLQGGYIDTSQNDEYGESGVDETNGMPNPPPVLFYNIYVPYWLEVTYKPHTHCEGSSCGGVCCPVVYYHWNEPPPKDYTPTLTKIKQTLANYFMAEFEDCFKTSVFEEIGIDVIRPVNDYVENVKSNSEQKNVNIEIGLNEEDISIELTYPLTVKKDGTETKIDTFRVTIPIRLKALYDSSLELVGKIVTKINEYPETPVQPKYIYVIDEEDCSSFDKNELTNVNNDDLYDTNKEIVPFVDFSTYYEDYINSYRFQFATKNVEVQGKCAG